MTTSHEQIESATDEGQATVDDQPVVIPPCEHADSSKEVVGQGVDTANDGSVSTYELSRCQTCGHESVTDTTGSTA